MLQLLKTCCLCLLFAGTSLCAEEKEDNDFLAPYLVNWSSTSSQFAHCDADHNNSAHAAGFSEKHFLLGACPSVSSINLFYASTALMHYAAANVLPDRYRRVLTDSRVNFQVSVFKEYSSMSVLMSF